jgi:hypothetical protein
MSINIARHAINRIVASPMTAPLPVVADNAPSDGLCQVGVPPAAILRLVRHVSDGLYAADFVAQLKPNWAEFDRPDK